MHVALFYDLNSFWNCKVHLAPHCPSRVNRCGFPWALTSQSKPKQSKLKLESDEKKITMFGLLEPYGYSVPYINHFTLSSLKICLSPLCLVQHSTAILIMVAHKNNYPSYQYTCTISININEVSLALLSHQSDMVGGEWGG